jgi:hypothetical protein
VDDTNESLSLVDQNKSKTEYLTFESNNDLRDHESDNLDIKYSKSSVYRSIIYWLSQDLLLTDYFSDQFPRLKPLSHFVDGASFVINKLWAPTFSGLFLFEMGTFFSKPDERYGTTLGDIILGNGNNQLAITSNLGSDLPGEWIFSLWLALIGGAITIGGIIQLARQYYQENMTDDARQIQDQDTQITSPDTNNIELTADPNLSHSNKILTGLKSLYINYSDWKSGQKVNIKLEPLFWLFLSYILYADMRLIKLFIKKIIALSEYLNQKKSCENEGKQFLYLPDYGNYECTVCGDWDFIEPRDVFDPQACLSGLLGPGNSPEFILSNLERVLKFGPNKTLDLSGQHWTNWTKTQWSNFLSNVSHTAHHFDIFNLSSSVLNLGFAHDGKVAELTDFLKKVNISRLDLRNQGMGNAEASVLSPALSNLHYLDMTSNRLTQTGFLINNTQTFEVLKLSNNPFKTSEIPKLFQPFQYASLTQLDVSQTNLNAEDLEALSKALENSKIKKLDISKNDFSQADLNVLGKNLSLDEINLSQCHLSDQQVVDFVSAQENHVTKADFSKNTLTDSVVIGIISASANGNLTTLNLNDNLISDVGAEELSKGSTETNIKEVGLAGTQITKEGFEKLLQGSFSSIDTSRNPIGNDAAQLLDDYKNTSSVENIDLSSTGMTDIGGKNLASALVGSNILALSVSNNKLSDQSLVPIVNNLESSNVTDINIKNNQMELNGAMALAETLPRTKLKNIDLQNNKIPDEGGLVLAKSLIQPTPHSESLGDEKISRDMILAVRRSKPVTDVRILNTQNNFFKAPAKRALRRVSPSIPNTHIYYAQQRNATSAFFARPQSNGLLTPGNSTQANGSAAQYLGLSLLTGIVPIILGLVAIYLIYQLFKKDTPTCKKQSHRRMHR